MNQIKWVYTYWQYEIPQKFLPPEQKVSKKQNCLLWLYNLDHIAIKYDLDGNFVIVPVSASKSLVLLENKQNSNREVSWSSVGCQYKMCNMQIVNTIVIL